MGRRSHPDCRAVGHPRLAFLYVIASQCWNTGRIPDALRYSEVGQTVLGSGRHELPFACEGTLGAVFAAIGQPERWVQWCRARLARGRDTHTVTRMCLVLALRQAGCGD